MKVARCLTCQQQRPFKRALGFGTLFAAIITAGLWLLAIPFYPLRCATCGERFF
jgi:hypothetical protein